MENPKIPYLDIDENFYIENDIVKVKPNAEVQSGTSAPSMEEMWANVEKIILKAKEYDESHRHK